MVRGSPRSRFEFCITIELIEGIIVAKMGKNELHMTSADLVQIVLTQFLPPGFFLTMGNPLTIVEATASRSPTLKSSEDIPRDYRSRRRTQGDAALVVEASDSSYRMDRYRKWVTYAGAGVRIYWIVDVNRNRLEVHSDPTGSGSDARYATTQILGPDDQVALMLDGREVARFAALACRVRRDVVGSPIRSDASVRRGRGWNPLEKRAVGDGISTTR